MREPGFVVQVPPGRRRGRAGKGPGQARQEQGLELRRLAQGLQSVPFRCCFQAAPRMWVGLVGRLAHLPQTALRIMESTPVRHC